MDSSADVPKRRRWGRWVLVALLALIVLVFALHALWGWWEERELDREVAALRAAGEPMVAGDFQHEPVNESDNAAPLLRKAAGLIDERSQGWERVEQMEVGQLLAEENRELVRTVVRQNVGALTPLSEARGKTGVDWQIPMRKPMVSTLLPDLGPQKNLAQLARMAALLAHEEGDDRVALARVRDLLMMSRAMGKMDLGAMPNLVSYFIGSTAAGAVMEMTADLRIGSGKGEVSEDQVRAVIGELLDDTGGSERVIRTVKFERAMGVEWITTKEAMWGGRLPSNGMEQAGLALRRYVMRPATFSDGRFLLRYGKAIGQTIEASGNWPAFKRASEGPKAMAQTLEASPNWHAMAKMAVANYERLMLQRFRATTLRRLAAAGLAVRLYQAGHANALPGNLEDLTPVYLHEAPGDLMSDGGTIRYSAQRGILWSVGDNGTDEGGSDQVVNEQEGRWGREDVVVELRSRRK